MKIIKPARNNCGINRDFYFTIVVTGVSPARTLMGRDPRSRLDLLCSPSTAEHVQEKTKEIDQGYVILNKLVEKNCRKNE